MSNKNKKNIFKKLNINRSELPTLIEEFCSAKFKRYRVSEIKELSDLLHRCEIHGDGKLITIDFYYVTDGTTTIQPNVGQYQDISLELASFILGRLEFSGTDKKNFSYSVRDLDKKDFDSIVDYLQLMEGNEQLNQDVNETNGYILYQFRSKIGDRLTLKYFTNGTLQVQGKPLYLYQEVTCFLSSFFPFDDIIKYQGEFFSVDMDPTDIRSEMQQMMPKAYNYLDDALRKILSASMALKKIDINLEDYSSFVFPALRTIEGYLKQLLKDNNIYINDSFNIFDRVGPKWVLNEETKKVITDNSTCKVIERAYNFYHKHRHSLFHTEYIVAGTRIIERKQDAYELILEAIRLIEETYDTIEVGAK